MTEVVSENNNEEVNSPSKYNGLTITTEAPLKKPNRFRKFLIKLVLFFILVAVGFYFYLRYKADHAVGVGPSALPMTAADHVSTSDNLSSSAAGGQNPNISKAATSYLADQQAFQDSLSRQITDLSVQIQSMRRAILTSRAGSGLTGRQDLRVIYRLIAAINTARPFLAELSDFKSLSTSSLYLLSIKDLDNFAAVGVPTTYDLSATLDILVPSIKRIYYLHNSIFMYYLSFLITVSKTKGFSSTDRSLDANINEVRQLLLQNQSELALQMATSTKLCEGSATYDWCLNLARRVAADKFVRKLQNDMIYNGVVGGSKHAQNSQKVLK